MTFRNRAGAVVDGCCSPTYAAARVRRGGYPSGAMDASPARPAAAGASPAKLRDRHAADPNEGGSANDGEMFRQVVEDLVANKEVNIYSRYESLEKKDSVGDFQFIVMEKYLSQDNELPFLERVVMNFYLLVS